MIPLDTLAVIAVVVLVVIVCVVVIAALRRRGDKCARCGTKLPRGAMHCPTCEGLRPQKDLEGMSQKPGGSPVSSVELIASDGPLAPQHFTISPQGLSIGRNPDNNIVLADELMVSRYHAVINLEQGRHVLYDKDSANGTWVNEQRVFRHTLVPGDRIQIWRSQFVFSRVGAPPPPPPPPSPVSAPVFHAEGESFDGYYLEGLIGRGGMSEVFKARDRNGRVVAIKILQETNPYLVDKFRQEGNRIGPLLRGHPNIVYVYEFGCSRDGRLYFVMEYVDAPSLRKMIGRRLPEPEVVGIVGQVCSALAFAHRKNIVHRDIKPENILITPDGIAKVLDFGIAKLTSASTVTRDKIVGTPEYISPEQARGEPVRPASDVYSLGVVLYEMLTGSVPFPRPRVDDPYRAALEVIRQHLKERPVPVRKKSPDAQISTQLDRATMRALEKNVKQRYKDAEEMGQALGYRDSVQLPVAPSEPLIRAGLAIVQGPWQGRWIPLADQSLTLGRADLGSNNTTISRHHVTIIYRGGGYWLQDMSKNGTWVDNQRVYGEIPLTPGAMIVIGDNVLRLDTESYVLN